MRYHWIYDTPALVGHANSTSRRVRAGLTAILDEPEARLTVPVTCLLEAYAQTPTDRHHLLDGLATSPGVTVEPISNDARDMAAVGQLVRDTGRPGAAHAARIALAGEGPTLVFTDTDLPAGILTRPV